MYIDGGSLKEAVQRLGSSAASASYADFLICKRCLVISGEDEVTTGTRSAAFKQAHADVAGVGDPEKDGQPYFVPFGHDRDTTSGYRTKKFPSNGVSDNIARWSNRKKPPFEWVTDSANPKKYRYVERTPEELAEFFGVDDTRALNRPYLIDAAIWWLRSTEVDDLLADDGTLSQDLAAERFIEDCGLSQAEVDALFMRGIPSGPVDGSGNVNG